MTKKLRAPQPKGDLLDAARELIAEADLLLSSKKRPTDRFRAAVERLRELVPAASPPPVSRAPAVPRTQEEWDEHVLAWALQLDLPITLDRAFAALAPDALAGSAEHTAIAASLNRLPRERFSFSWYMANTSLAPMWTRQSK